MDIKLGGFTQRPPARTLNLKRKRLRIASVKSLPFQDVKRIDDSHFIGSGFSFEIVEQMSQHFNFTYDIVVPQDEDFGMLINGSSWTGLVGMLLNKPNKELTEATCRIKIGNEHAVAYESGSEVTKFSAADMAAAPISVTQARRNVITFSTSLYTDSLGVILARTEGRQNNGALLAPFTNSVWMIVIIVAISICPILYVLIHLSKYLLRKGKPMNTKEDLTFAECVWFVYSGLMKQGFNKSSSFNPVRVLMAAWWLTCMIIVAFYTANLTAFMTLENSSPELTVERLVQSGERWIFKKGTAFSNELFKGKRRKYANEFSLLKNSVIDGIGMMVNSEEEVMGYVQKGYAYMQEVNVLNYFLFKDFSDSGGQCQYNVLDLQFFEHATAFAFPNGSPYASIFSEYIEFLRKSGLLQKWMQQHLVSADVCAFHFDNKLSRNEQALTIHEFHTAFYILCVGIIVGTISFVIERKHMCW